MWNKIYKWFEKVGTNRAAAELYRLGYRDAAKKIILERSK